MVAGMKYRHELKYVVTAVQMALLESRIQNLISLDSHAGEEGSYRIRSLYFDDRYHSCYLENEIGTDPREKFRIRIYNGDLGRISLELKRKEHGMTQKIACPLGKLGEVDGIVLSPAGVGIDAGFRAHKADVSIAAD